VRTPCGEVDVLVRRPGILACVEVKTARVAELERALERPAFRPGRRLNARRLRRQGRAARYLAARLRTPDGRPPRARVDLVEVWVEAASGRVRLIHHPGLRALDGRVPPLGPGRGATPA